jgi:hypothetical protein
VVDILTKVVARYPLPSSCYRFAWCLTLSTCSARVALHGVVCARLSLDPTISLFKPAQSPHSFVGV